MRANSQQVGFCFRHTFIYSLFCNICFISYSQKYVHSLRFIAVLDDCNDSKEADNDRVQEEGRGREEAKEKRGRVRIGSKGEGRKERRRKSALGERGARSTCTLYERNPRRRRWAVVHFMHAYARLDGIPCTPSPDYTEYHAPLRLILPYPVYDSD